MPDTFRTRGPMYCICRVLFIFDFVSSVWGHSVLIKLHRKCVNQRRVEALTVLSIKFKKNKQIFHFEFD